MNDQKYKKYCPYSKSLSNELHPFELKWLVFVAHAHTKVENHSFNACDVHIFEMTIVQRIMQWRQPL